jgi:hypothetical protein
VSFMHATRNGIRRIDSCMDALDHNISYITNPCPRSYRE